MKKINFFLVVVLCTALSITNGYSQDNTTIPSMDFKRNSIYGTLGFAGLAASVTGSFEHILTQNLEKGVVATFANVNVGLLEVVLGQSATYLTFKYGILTGSKAGHFEAAAGPNFKVGGEEEIAPIAFNLGYRLQRPGKAFMFRTGIGYPEFIYFGAGFSF